MLRLALISIAPICGASAAEHASASGFAVERLQAFVDAAHARSASAGEHHAGDVALQDCIGQLRHASAADVRHFDARRVRDAGDGNALLPRSCE